MRKPRVAAPALPTSVDEDGLFRTLFAAYPDALIVTDATGTIVQANPAAAELLLLHGRRS